MMTMEESIQMENMRKEIETWRKEFLQERFSTSFRFIPQSDRKTLEAYFSSIPSSSFSTAWEEWDKCISTLLQSKAR